LNHVNRSQCNRQKSQWEQERQYWQQWLNIGLHFVSYATGQSLQQDIVQMQASNVVESEWSNKNGQFLNTANNALLLGIPIRLVVDVDLSWGAYAYVTNGNASGIVNTAFGSSILTGQTMGYAALWLVAFVGMPPLVPVVERLSSMGCIADGKIAIPMSPLKSYQFT
jgi:hypothetical protein